MATFTEVFNECWENAAVEDIVALHNVWAYEESSDDLIYDNIDSQLDGNSVLWAASCDH